MGLHSCVLLFEGVALLELFCFIFSLSLLSLSSLRLLCLLFLLLMFAVFAALAVLIVLLFFCFPSVLNINLYRVATFTRNKKEMLKTESGVLVTTYSMITHTNLNHESKKVVADIQKRCEFFFFFSSSSLFFLLCHLLFVVGLFSSVYCVLCVVLYPDRLCVVLLQRLMPLVLCDEGSGVCSSWTRCTWCPQRCSGA
jgi:hypothetical protein